MVQHESGFAVLCTNTQFVSRGQGRAQAKILLFYFLIFKELYPYEHSCHYIAGPEANILVDETNTACLCMVLAVFYLFLLPYI